jgi:hypothetical protein
MPDVTHPFLGHGQSSETGVLRDGDAVRVRLAAIRLHLTAWDSIVVTTPLGLSEQHADPNVDAVLLTEA